MKRDIWLSIIALPLSIVMILSIIRYCSMFNFDVNGDLRKQAQKLEGYLANYDTYPKRLRRIITKIHHWSPEKRFLFLFYISQKSNFDGDKWYYFIEIIDDLDPDFFNWLKNLSLETEDFSDFEQKDQLLLLYEEYLSAWNNEK